MNNFTLRKIIIHILIILFIFSLDRFSKIYILNIVETAGEVDIYINSILHLILVWNTGIGFGLFSSDQSYAYNFITILIQGYVQSNLHFCGMYMYQTQLKPSEQ